MIELEHQDHDDPTSFYGVLWTDETNEHVIAEEGGLFYVRDENGERGAYDTFEQAFTAAQKAWGEVTLAPANRVTRNIAEGRSGEVSDYLLEYLAAYGAVGIDVQVLANLVFVRQEED